MALKVVVDTNIFISVKNKEEPYYSSSKAVLDKVDEGVLRGIVSTIILAEICSGYYAAGELEEKDEFLTHILTSPNYTIADVTVGVADEAGRIRANTKLRLPDAIIVASGLKEKADYIVTYDEQLKKAGSLIKVVTAEEILDKLSAKL
jgi:predicted nucleic acid-binding protein